MTDGLGDDPREALLRRFLLGLLGPEEEERVGDSVLADEAAHEELLAVQDDLIHASLAGQLSPAERERFESHFLASPRRRERVDFMRGLLASIERVPRPVAPRAPAAGWTRLLPWAAVLAVGLAGGGWSLHERHRAEDAIAAARTQEAVLQARVAGQERRIGELEEQARVAPGDTDVITWRLDPGLERGAARPPLRRAAAGWIRLRMTLPHDFGARLFQASLQTPEGREILSVPGLRAAPGPDGPLLDVMAPAPLLGVGTYLLSVRAQAAGPQPELAVAAFSVR